MSITYLKEEEIAQVGSIIDQILPTIKFKNIIENKALIMVHKKRRSIYLIDEEDRELIEAIFALSREKECVLEFMKIKLGFWINSKFRIGIESLPFLAPLCNNPLLLQSKRQVTRFIYGKNVEISLKAAIIDERDYKDGSMIIVFSKSRIPLGYARLKLGKDKLYLENIIDIGIYLRSEKTAF